MDASHSDFTETINDDLDLAVCWTGGSGINFTAGLNTIIQNTEPIYSSFVCRGRDTVIMDVGLRT